MKPTIALPSIAILATLAATLLLRPWEPDAASGDPAPAEQVPVGATPPPRLVNQRPDESAAAPAAEELTETVMGIAVRKDRNCTVTRHYVDLGNGMVSEAYSCVGAVAATGDFDHYDDSVLQVLAYGDAGAASALGKRLVAADTGRARALVLRALALEPRNMEPAMWLASQAYSLRGDSAKARRATAESYVISRIAQAFDRDIEVAWIVDDLRAAGFDDAAIASLDSRVVNDLQAIRDIRLEVLGASAIGEDLP